MHENIKKIQIRLALAVLVRRRAEFTEVLIVTSRLLAA